MIQCITVKIKTAKLMKKSIFFSSAIACLHSCLWLNFLTLLPDKDIKHYGYQIICFFLYHSISQIPHKDNHPHFFILTPDEFDPIFRVASLCFFAPPSFGAFFSCLFVFFMSFCLCAAVGSLVSPFCVCCFFCALPFAFIRKRGVVQMVFLLGGFFSSLRFILLNRNRINQKNHN